MFNPPPADLHCRDPLIHIASKTVSWFRSYRTDRDPVYFGRNGAHRWDAPNGEFGVLYLASDEYCALWNRSAAAHSALDSSRLSS